MGPNEARIEIQDSVVVSTTRISDRPSTPSLNWIPNAGIQGAATTNWKSWPRSPDGMNPVNSSSEMIQVATAKPRARPRASRSGANATTIAPTSGRNVTIVRIGRSEIDTSAACQEEERAGHHDQADRDAQRVVLDAPGLDLADLPAGPDRDRGETVDRAVDDPPVEPPERVGDAAADHDEHQVVELVEPPLVERRAVQERETGAERGDELRPGRDPDPSDLGAEEVPAGPAAGRRDPRSDDQQRAVDAEQLELVGVAQEDLRLLEDRLQPALEDRRAEGQSQQQPEEDRRDREQDQRPGHDRRRLVDLGLDARVDAALAPEREAHEPEHVEGRQQRDEDAD